MGQTCLPAYLTHGPLLSIEFLIVCWLEVMTNHPQSIPLTDLTDLQSEIHRVRDRLDLEGLDHVLINLNVDVAGTPRIPIHLLDSGTEEDRAKVKAAALKFLAGWEEQEKAMTEEWCYGMVLGSLVALVPSFELLRSSRMTTAKKDVFGVLNVSVLVQRSVLVAQDLRKDSNLEASRRPIPVSRVSLSK